MANFVPSKYQKTVYTYIQKGKGNAVIDAVAGSGKSTTIVNALKLIPASKSVLFLAFNASIVEELKIKIGNIPNVDIRTLNSLGFKIVRTAYKNVQLDDTKYKVWINDKIQSGMIQPSRNLESEEYPTWKDNINRLIQLGRVNLVRTFDGLMNLAEKHCLDIIDNEVKHAINGIFWGEQNTAVIDYTDQIYFPNVKRMNCPQYDWVFIDECQDLNAAQRELFLKCVKPGGRFIAVGDPRQAIYGFSGADVESFNLLKAIPHTAKLPLSVCYRCDKTIIELAQTIVPQITWRDNAPDGVIDHNAKMEDVKDGDMILCRVTAPLIDLCMKYIASGVKAYVKGKDIGMNLINMIKKTNKKRMPQVMERLNHEAEKILNKIVAHQHCTAEEAKDNDVYQSYLDKLNAIEILSEGLDLADDVINRIEGIFNNDSKNGICLSTIHKSKGLESDRVFIICEDKLYLKHCMKVPWMAEQEKNLVYVAFTRAKHHLGFIQDFKARK